MLIDKYERSDRQDFKHEQMWNTFQKAEKEKLKFYRVSGVRLAKICAGNEMNVVGLDIDGNCLQWVGGHRFELIGNNFDQISAGWNGEIMGLRRNGIPTVFNHSTRQWEPFDSKKNDTTSDTVRLTKICVVTEKTVYGLLGNSGRSFLRIVCLTTDRSSELRGFFNDVTCNHQGHLYGLGGALEGESSVVYQYWGIAGSWRPLRGQQMDKMDSIQIAQDFSLWGMRDGDIYCCDSKRESFSWNCKWIKKTHLFPSRTSQISVVDEHTIWALTKDGKVYCCGEMGKKMEKRREVALKDLKSRGKWIMDEFSKIDVRMRVVLVSLHDGGNKQIRFLAFL